MRFSRNMDETERMILTAIDKGINCFDTAYMYPNSEETLGTIPGKHKKRSLVFIRKSGLIDFLSNEPPFRSTQR
ncbi:MAG: aldo/keto reductase [Treponema sp.]|nr:aldo/keto reductase [Treponema sp.]